MHEIILASQSPRRKQLLEWAEIPFKVVVQSTDESFSKDMPVDQVPIHIAQQKAFAVKDYLQQQGQYNTEQIILAADTIVVLGDEVINKPVDRNDAMGILSKLSGNTHRVITGVWMMKDKSIRNFSVTTEVRFLNLSEEQIAFYIDRYQPYDKAGAYAIQEWIGVTGIASINGDFYNVMGLPVSRVVQELGMM